MGAIKELLALHESPDSNCGAVNDIIDRQIARLEELSHSIASLRGRLLSLRERCQGTGAVSECGILKGLMEEGPAEEDRHLDCGEGAPRIVWKEKREGRAKSQKNGHG
jgi:hypothetical protein